jgi:hypothetical protein
VRVGADSIKGSAILGQILGQFCINVTDLERSISFWEGVCGLPVRSRTAGRSPNLLASIGGR